MLGTYAPVGKLSIFRYMISNAVQHDLLFDHLDAATASLNPAIDEDVHMILPKGIPGAGTIVKLYIVPGRSESVHQTEHRQQQQHIPLPLCR